MTVATFLTDALVSGEVTFTDAEDVEWYDRTCTELEPPRRLVFTFGWEHN